MYLNGEFPYNSHDNINLYKDITISNIKFQCYYSLYLDKT